MHKTASKKKVTVVLATRTVGQRFATVGVIKSAATGTVIAECEEIRPYGFKAAAIEDAANLANRRGDDVTDDDGD